MDIIRYALAILMVASGAGHFVFPTYFRSLVPGWVPHPRTIVRLTGLANILSGLAMLIPAVAAAGAVMAVILFVGYMSSHIDAAMNADPNGPVLARPLMVATRIVVNVCYIALAVLLVAQG